MIAIAIQSTYIWLAYKKLHSNQSKVSEDTVIITNRLGGFLLMALIPLYFWGSELLNQSYILITKPHLIKSVVAYIIIASIVLATNHKLAKLNAHQANYPAFQIINNSDYWLNIFLWLVYLCGYEFLFRGIFLFESVKLFGIIPAITFNVIVYALAHLPKGKFETIGAIPLGIMLCTLALYLQTFWIAFLIHATIAISNDIYCYKRKNYKLLHQQK